MNLTEKRPATDRDWVWFGNRWGCTTTSHGATLYSSPEQARQWDRLEWGRYIEAIRAARAELGPDPDLDALEDWARSKYVGA